MNNDNNIFENNDSDVSFETEDNNKTEQSVEGEQSGEVFPETMSTAEPVYDEMKSESGYISAPQGDDAPEHSPYQYNEQMRTQVYINGGNNSQYYAENQKRERKKSVKKQKSGRGFIVLVAILCIILSFGAAFGGTVLAARFISAGRVHQSKVPPKFDNSAPGSNKSQSEYEQSLPASPSVIVPGTGESNAGTYSEVVAKVADSVVEIRTEKVLTSSIFSQYVTKGAGSGVIISADGYIVTNHHVIEDASAVTVYTTNGTKYAAKVIGSDPDSDLAIIKVEAEGLTHAVFGDSSKLVVGEEVVSIGNPLGNLGGTVTNGIISALAREVTISGTQMTLLQTNAAVNPGNSGGGLFNMSGELVGIVNAKSSGSGIEGLGFAIPGNVAANVAEQLIEYGYVRGRVSIGITYMDIKDSYTAMMYRVDAYGMYILESEQNDELKIGDRVTAFNGNVVTFSNDLKKYLNDCKVGDKVKLTVIRNGKYVDVEIECYEYVPGKVEKDEDKTEENSYEDIFGSPFSSFPW